MFAAGKKIKKRKKKTFPPQKNKPHGKIGSGLQLGLVLPYLDLARVHGEQHHDGEAREQPRVLDGEGDQGAAVLLVLPAHLVHLRELQGKKLGWQGSVTAPSFLHHPGVSASREICVCQGDRANPGVLQAESFSWEEIPGFGVRIYHVSQRYVQEHPSSQSKDPVGREVAASHDAKGQAHVAAAGGDEVEEESLANGHAGVQQDHKVPWGEGRWEDEEGRAGSSIGTALA